MFGSVPEQNKPVNDTYAQKGEKIIASGASYRSRTLASIRSGASFSITIDDFDALNGVWIRRNVTYKTNGPWASNERPINDGWRRGFTIAIGVCEGSDERGPMQTAVYQTVAEAGGRSGFEAGQAVQFERTAEEARNVVARQKLLDAAAYQATFTQNKVALFTDEGQAQKMMDRDAWVEHYIHPETAARDSMDG